MLADRAADERLQLRNAGHEGGVFSVIIGSVAIAFLAFFMLLDGPRLLERFYDFLPDNTRPRWRRVGTEIYRTVGGYVTGNVFISVIAGVAAMAALFILGSKYSVAQAVVVAILDLIPLAGATMAAVIVSVVVFVELGWVQGAIIIAFCAAMSIGYDWLFDALSPDADPKEILREIERRGLRRVLVVGHMPHLGKLLGYLVSGFAAAHHSLNGLYLGYGVLGGIGMGWFADRYGVRWTEELVIKALFHFHPELANAIRSQFHDRAVPVLETAHLLRNSMEEILRRQFGNALALRAILLSWQRLG